MNVKSKALLIGHTINFLFCGSNIMSVYGKQNYILESPEQPLKSSEILTNNFPTEIFTIACLLIIFYFTYRLYKRVGRRCRKKGCGSLRVKRISKIHLAKDETISIKSVNGELRWWIRRVVKETFSVCPDCGNIELVKTSEDPISYIHAIWIKFKDPQQYQDDPKLNNIAYFTGKDRLTKKHLLIDENSIRTDTPPIRISDSKTDILGSTR